MKTAISLPNQLFQRVERHAHQLGISRSEFIARAARRYADDLDQPKLTEAIDAVLVDEDDDLEFVRAATKRRFAPDE